MIIGINLIALPSEQSSGGFPLYLHDVSNHGKI